MKEANQGERRVIASVISGSKREDLREHLPKVATTFCGRTFKVWFIRVYECKSKNLVWKILSDSLFLHYFVILVDLLSIYLYRKNK